MDIQTYDIIDNKKASELLKSMHRRDFICSECQKDDDECKSSCEYGKALDHAIKALEAQGWIPVTERLPETTEDVLVTDKYYMFVAWYGDSWHSSDAKIDQQIKPIIAWMPLPQPYTKEDNS